MKSTHRLELLQRDYIHKLLSDVSVENKTAVFTQAKRIFNLVKRKTRKR